MLWQNIIAGIIVLFTAGILAAIRIPWLKVASPYTAYATLGLLGLGLLFFLLNRTRLMFTALLCCGALCVFLKASVNQRLRLAAARNPPIRLAHINLGNVEGDYDSVINYILATPANVVSVQELTPDWAEILRVRFRQRFPYQAMFTRLDPYGSALFSEMPFLQIDTLWYADIPSLAVTMDPGLRHPVHVITAQVEPPVNQAAYQVISEHLHVIADVLRRLEGEVILAGDFHLPPWSAEINRLKTEARLEYSRRDMQTRNLDGSVSLPRIPVDHMLFRETLECTSFVNLGNASVGRLGIYGTYAPKYEYGKMAE